MSATISKTSVCRGTPSLTEDSRGSLHDNIVRKNQPTPIPTPCPSAFMAVVPPNQSAAVAGRAQRRSKSVADSICRDTELDLVERLLRIPRRIARTGNNVGWRSEAEVTSHKGCKYNGSPDPNHNQSHTFSIVALCKLVVCSPFQKGSRCPIQ
jgi:hypothetical protein